jgi:hypothetical protein
MVQIIYDGKEFYTEDPISKKREPIPVDRLPKDFIAGDRIFFDYNDSLIVSKPITRDELVAVCERVYRNPEQNFHFKIKIDKTPLKSLESL